MAVGKVFGKVFVCRRCGRKFTNEADVSVHIEAHRSVERTQFWDVQLGLETKLQARLPLDRASTPEGPREDRFAPAAKFTFTDDVRMCGHCGGRLIRSRAGSFLSCESCTVKTACSTCGAPSRRDGQPSCRCLQDFGPEEPKVHRERPPRMVCGHLGLACDAGDQPYCAGCNGITPDAWVVAPPPARSKDRARRSGPVRVWHGVKDFRPPCAPGTHKGRRRVDGSLICMVCGAVSPSKKSA